jgi:hypothetical protein
MRSIIARRGVASPHGTVPLVLCKRKSVAVAGRMFVLAEKVCAPEKGRQQHSTAIENTMAKTYNSGDSPMVTHLTTSPPVKGLTYEDRTGFCALLFPVVVCGRQIN